jgi:hypothetical protein
MHCARINGNDTWADEKEEACDKARALQTAGTKCHQQLLASQQLQRLTELKLAQRERELKEHAQSALESRRQWKQVQHTDETRYSTQMTIE